MLSLLFSPKFSMKLVEPKGPLVFRVWGLRSWSQQAPVILKTSFGCLTSKLFHQNKIFTDSSHGQPHVAITFWGGEFRSQGHSKHTWAWRKVPGSFIRRRNSSAKKCPQQIIWLFSFSSSWSKARTCVQKRTMYAGETRQIRQGSSVYPKAKQEWTCWFWLVRDKTWKNPKKCWVGCHKWFKDMQWDWLQMRTFSTEGRQWRHSYN